MFAKALEIREHFLSQMIPDIQYLYVHMYVHMRLCDANNLFYLNSLIIPYIYFVLK